MLLCCALGLTGCNPATPREAPSPETAVPLATTVSATPGAPIDHSKSSLVPVAAFSLPLGGEWRFCVDADDAGEDGGWAEPSFDDSTWTTVTVPHTWGTMPQHADYEGIAWYRRRFDLPKEAEDGHLRLHFDAVFYMAQVWLNGQYLGEHEGGYTPFEFDVSAIAQPGTENVVAVRVDNARSMDRIPAILRRTWSFDWWNWGGIVRDVYLEITSRAYIADQQVVAVPHLTDVNQADTATVTVKVTVHNESKSMMKGTLVADVLDEENDLGVLEIRPGVEVGLPPGESTEIELVTEVREPKLWHFDHPHLYRWSASLLNSDNKLLHQDETIFGIRRVELQNARFYLNREPMRLVGLTRHADSPQHGLAETVAIITRDYEDLRTLNMVFSRPVHYPQHAFILDYCDRWISSAASPS